MKQETPRARSIKGAKDLIKGLNPDHDLFNHLHDEMPQWWLNLLDDPEIYIEVRKENYINAYYYGGNIAKITWNNGYVAKTHPAFKDKANDWKRISSLREEQISKKRILKKEGKSKEADAIKLEPYPSSDLVDCLGLLSSKEGIDLLKRNILDIYLQDDGNAKGLATTSEKKIQGKLITETGSPYIDSEFALNYVDTEAGNTENALQRVRIDLIELVDGNIRFVELKNIADNRMLTKVNPEVNAEILDQLNRYEHFIEVFGSDMLEYYAKLLKIKALIGLDVPSHENIRGLVGSPKLLVADTYIRKDEEGTPRDIRRKAIIRIIPEKYSLEIRKFGQTDFCL